MTVYYDKPLSYSSIALFKKCPRAWAEVYLLGRRTPAGPAAERGTLLHAAIEGYFQTGQPSYLKEYPVLERWQGFMDDMRRDWPGVKAEVDFARSEGWGVTAFDSPSAIFRGRLDAYAVRQPPMRQPAVRTPSCTLIADWKSGKPYPDHEEQGLTYVALAPITDEYLVQIVYLDSDPKEILAKRFTRADREAKITSLAQDIERVRTTEDHWPTPSVDACRWCNLNWRKGGSCRAAP